MRCRSCDREFWLNETITYSCPPGKPATPREVLTVLLVLIFLLLLTLAPGVAELFKLIVFGVLVLPTLYVLLSWVSNYLGWLQAFDDYDPTKKAGTCPHCGTRNRIWPWSA